MRIAVVVPAYRQPQFLTGAVLSALAQRPPAQARVVIVNDGCPYTATHAAAEALRDAHPDRVDYVRQENAGLSAARNAGVERALERWPDSEAVFPLDADNLLEPWALGALATRLQLEPGAAWAAPAVELFGEGHGIWDTAPPFSPYRQLYENQCDAGTLIRRAVFDAGLRYDPRLRAYEDWLFILQAAVAGFTGVQAGACGFRYRVRSGSMLAHARANHEDHTARLRSAAAEAFAPGAIVRREHAEAPRFALVSPGEEVRSLAAADLEATRTELPVWCAMVGASAGGTVRGAPFVAPITVLGPEAAFARLEESGRLAGILLLLQHALRDDAVAALEGLQAARTAELHLLPGDGDLGTLREAVRAARPHVAPVHAHTLSAFAAHLHLNLAETVFPHAGAANAGATWFLDGSGGAGRAAARTLAWALRRDDPRAELHLATFEEPGAPDRGPFSTVTVLDERTEALLPVLIAGAATIVHAGAPRPGLAATAHDAVRVAIAAGARLAFDDASVDAYLAGTEDARRRLEDDGATPEKISVVSGWDDAGALRRAVAAARTQS